MLLAGVQPKAAAARLGHSSVTLFNETYAHMLAEFDEDAAAKVEGAIRRRPVLPRKRSVPILPLWCRFCRD